MNILLAIIEDQAVSEALRAAISEPDLLLVEPTLDEAARRLVSIQPDVILLDDTAQGGAAAMAFVKELAPNVPIIIFSGRGDVVTEAALHRAGADEVVSKPFSCESLQQSLAAVTQNPSDVRTAYSDERHNVDSSASLSRYQMALRWLSRISTYDREPLRLGQSFVECAIDIFGAVQSAVILETDGTLQVVASHGLDEAITSSIRLQYGAGLMRWFDEHACLLHAADRNEDPQVAKEMQLLRARLAAPLLRNGRVFGAIVLGEQISGENYTREERELLSLIARSTAPQFQAGRTSTQHAEPSSQHEQILDQMSSGVVVVSRDKAIITINSSAAKILQVEPAAVLGKNIQKLGSAFADVVLRTLLDEGPQENREIRDPAIGASLKLDTQSMEDGGVVVTFSRLSDEKVDTGDIAYSPFWEYLSSRLAQEIKNPMVAINTFAQLLPRKYESEDFRDAFSQIVQKEVNRINSVVETLFQFARNPQLSLQECNVNEAVRNVLKTFEDELESRSITLDATWAPTLSDAQLDPEFFSQALHNILQNSIEAMPTGGKLSINTKSIDDQVEIRIEDSGAGISVKDPSMIFMPFFSTKEYGMGLGLPLANRIFQQHHGEIKLVKGENGGSCFQIHLPMLHKTEEKIETP
jgi:nitrogen-specific signal transduction histidine kinase/DNA-binding response OmpR family regulator